MANADEHHWLTSTGMAQLLDRAIAEWVVKPNDSPDARRSPRIALPHGPQIRIASYRFQNEEFVSAQAATLLDLSADGMRISTTQAISPHAIVFFDLSPEPSEQQLGLATVVQCMKHDQEYEIGLKFGEAVSSLEITTTIPPAERTARSGGVLAVAWHGIQSAFRLAFHIVNQRDCSRVLLTASRQGTLAWFVVEAKLTRYCATLVVGGQKVAARSAPLHDRLCNLVSRAARATSVRLSSHGFSGWATVRPNTIAAFDLVVEEPGASDSTHGEAPTISMMGGESNTANVFQPECTTTG